MALAVPYSVVNNNVTANTQLFTIPTTGAYSGYARDLVITNSGVATTVFVTLNAASAATTAASFQIPPGGTVLLTECQLPVGGIVSAIPTSGGTASVSVGFASVVSVI